MTHDCIGQYGGLLPNFNDFAGTVPEAATFCLTLKAAHRWARERGRSAKSGGEPQYR